MEVHFEVCVHEMLNTSLLEVSRYGRHKRVASTEIYLHTDLSDLARGVNKAHRRLETWVTHPGGYLVQADMGCLYPYQGQVVDM
jgi:hypothetical protein